MPSTDTLDTTTRVFGTAMKFFRLLVTCGATVEQLQVPITSPAKRRNLLEYLAAGCPKINYASDGNAAVALRTPKGYAAARAILGNDFISPEEVMAVRSGTGYDTGQLHALVASIPSLEVLQQLKDNGFALVPQPPRPLTLLNVRSLESGLFYKQDWYNSQQFAANNNTGTGWLAVKKTPVNGSTSKTWDEQNRLLKEGETVPCAAEMSWFITTFFKVRGVRLFENVYVRCSDLGSSGYRVYVGSFDAKGLYVDLSWDGIRYSYLGLGSARKF